MSIPTIQETFDTLLIEVCAKHGISPAVLSSGAHRARRTSEARGEMIHRLNALGFAAKAIANLLNMTAPAVNYHLYPNVRKNSMKRRKAYHEAARAEASQ